MRLSNVDVFWMVMFTIYLYEHSTVLPYDLRCQRSYRLLKMFYCWLDVKASQGITEEGAQLV